MYSLTKHIGKTLILCLSIALFPPVSMATEKPNLLVMGEDDDKDSVPRDSRVFNRVLDAMTNQLGDNGFDVFDETAITLDDFTQGRTRRTDAELIDIARSVRRPPVDILVIFSIYASANDVGHATKIKTRIPGRVLNVKTGQRLGNFTVDSPREWTAKSKCSRECILETVGKYSEILANDLGSVLSDKVIAITGSGIDDQVIGTDMDTAFELVFDGFNSEEMFEIEEYYVKFSGYRNHRPTLTTKTHAEVWYETDIRTAKFDRNLKKMFEQMGIKAHIMFSGNRFSIKKISERKKRTKDSNHDW